MRRLLVLSLMGIWICYAPVSSQAAQDDPPHGWQIKGAVNALQLVGVEQLGNHTTFLVKNVGTQPIVTVFVHGTGREAGNFGFDRFQADPLLPGDMQRLEIVNAEANAQDKVWIVALVLFSDGTAVGDNRLILFTKTNHLGQMLEQERINFILARIPPDQKADDTTLDSIHAKLGNSPDNPAQAFAELESIQLPAGVDLNAVRSAGKQAMGALFSGVNAARALANNRIERLRQVPIADTGRRSDLFKEMRELYTDLSAKNHAALAVPGMVW